MKLIKYNQPTQEITKTGIKHTLYGRRGEVILSTYSNNRKIELFIGNKLFASSKISNVIFTEQSAHMHQLYEIESALGGQRAGRTGANTPVGKQALGATPQQTELLQNAWWKSQRMNLTMCDALGNSR